MLQNLSITPASAPNLSMKSPWRFTLCMMGFLDLEKHFAFYGAYHSNPINIVIHICLDKKSGFVAALMCFACWVGSSVFADRLGPSLAVKLAPPSEFALLVPRLVIGISVTITFVKSEESGFEETHIVESVSWDDLERNAASKTGGSSERHHSWRSHQHDSSRKEAAESNRYSRVCGRICRDSRRHPPVLGNSVFLATHIVHVQQYET
ncbi:hypothetical protein F2Q69_00021238 [Brassica cretica]|uniref:Uncharacterized protein n=1 Tax=Brassica cretica TaxID=69181 RepID=A0A8S9QEL1_BRACR|nr:hypothetical protein F2Q69_00021238 [Brassica cretica]